VQELKIALPRRDLLFFDMANAAGRPIGRPSFDQVFSELGPFQAMTILCGHGGSRHQPKSAIDSVHRMLASITPENFYNV
jgi:hypothetical protein